MGLGALSLLSFVVELVTIEHGVRADSPLASCSTFTFAWYALIARTPRLEPPWTPPALASAGVVHQQARTALEGPQIARFFSSPRLAGLAPSASPRGSRASLFASSSACSCTAWSRLCASFSLVAAESSTALRCCDFHSVLFCAFHSARVRRCFFGPRRAIPQWIATWA